MNILYLAHRIPYPPDKGDKLRAFHQIEHLAQRHAVFCACFVDDPRDMRHVETLRRWCAEVVAVPLSPLAGKLRGLVSFARGGTITEAYYRHPAMTRAVDDAMRRIDLDAVVAFSSGMAPYALRVPAVRRVLDICDLDSRKWLAYAAESAVGMSAVYRLEACRLAEREVEWTRRFDATTLITRHESDDLRVAAAARGIELRDRLHVVGNGVDLPELSSGDPATIEPIVGFIGQMDYRPNVDAVTWFVHECWPALRRAVPAARFRIVGRSPSRIVRRLARVPGVEVVGAVKDVQTELQRFAVSVAPLRIARGLQNKVLEAMAAARPVVLSRAAATGIGAVDGVDYFVADDASDMSRCVIRLLADSGMRERVGAAARSFVAERHQWAREMEKFEGLVTGIVSVAGAHCVRIVPSSRSVSV